MCLRCFRCFLRQGSKGRLNLHGFYLNRGNLIILPCNDLRVSFRCLLRSDILLSFGLLTERIDKKCRQSGIGFIHKEAGGILRADLNALRPLLERLRNAPVKVFLLNGVCKDIPDALRRELLKDAFHGSFRIQAVISIVGADCRFNRTAAFLVCSKGGAICFHLTGFIGVICRLAVNGDFRLFLRNSFLYGSFDFHLCGLRFLCQQHLELGVNALNHLSRRLADGVQRAFQLFGFLAG